MASAELKGECLGEGPSLVRLVKSAKDSLGLKGERLSAWISEKLLEKRCVELPTYT